MAYRIAKYVHVAGVLLVPGDVPPPGLADQVTNPKAWRTAPEAPEPRRFEASDQGDQDPDSEENDTTGQTGDDPPAPEQTAGPVEDTDPEPALAVEGEEPPRPAKTAKVEVWREYIFAVADVTKAELDGLTKDQLIEMADQLDNDQ